MEISNENLSDQYNPARIYFAQASNRKEELSSSAGSATISDGEQLILFIACAVILLIFRQGAIVLIPAFLFWYFCGKSAPTSAKYNASNLSNSVTSLCERNGWEMISPDKILSDERKGFIGSGEKEVFSSLVQAGLSAHHQVCIQPFRYTADIVCVNPTSQKACVVEIDGIQHWTNPENISRDKIRMRDMAQKGISTIRFKNHFAQDYPHRCRDEVIKLLR